MPITYSARPECALQVQGCTRSLLKEKNYFRRYRCCKEHSRAPLVIIDGEEKRFCQQVVDRSAGFCAEPGPRHLIAELLRSDCFHTCEMHPDNGA